MRAIQVHKFGGPEELSLEVIPDPVPGFGQVVVRAKAIGVNPVDTYIRAGLYGDRTFPFTPGSDAAGLIEVVGPGVGNIKLDDRVYVFRNVSGAYAEKILCDVGQVHPLPDNVGFEEGAALGVPYGTAYQALFHRAYGLAGESVLVHGASGGVGVAAVQWARAAGLTVYGTAGTERGLEMVRAQGAHYVVNHKSPGYLEDIKNLTGGQGLDIILEMAAHINLGKDLGVLAQNGRVVVIGSRGKIEIDPRQTMGANLSILGMTLGVATPLELRAIYAAIGAGLEIKSLRPVIGEIFQLGQASKAHEAVMQEGAHGKIVLIP